MNKELTDISKYLSFVLRHKPEAINLVLDEQGWAEINALIANTKDYELSVDLIRLVVETNDKQRFSIDEAGHRIRANQGHSISVDLGLSPRVPPSQLIHGTAERFVVQIEKEGLLKGNRQYVHLTESESVGSSVGARYGKPVCFTIDAKQMHEDGFEFYKTINNVWLVDSVPSQYLSKR
ncbi:RNA:NAD 2'-phosphotransferase [Grimontia indica]|uniref:Probable RNA 2'-phosphotransferase n=1 Tax=Grimontia indica TaxID=1056512 RepID=R1IJX8_9GAMM|nr:RNA 2'-phosphotransferase [Grimontia indica]EOD77787.1 RNA:NAD 2'-phosphotransferase [Grimontia indica]